MNKLLITGGNKLQGSVAISGAKNAALPLMAASLLTDETLALSNVPDLADVKTLAKLLEQHGVSISIPPPLRGGDKEGGDESYARTSLATPTPTLPPQGGGRRVILNARAVDNLTAPYELVRTMRASVLVLGPLLARFGKARVSLPGGCAIGTRPIDLHLKALEKMGAHIELAEGYIDAHTHGRLQGAEITFEKVSVGATENLLMAAALAQGETILKNAAREPEVCDLARCLQAMGAKIEGIGTDEIIIQGVDNLHGASHTVVADRIEAGSFAAAAAATGGSLELVGVTHELLASVIDKFEEAGVRFSETPRGLLVERTGEIHGVDIMTQPFPGYPTDMQAQMMALLSLADGASMMTETIFENRYMHVPELTRMGANITVHGASAMIRGVKKLRAAEVMATDLRASLSLVIAALVAEGETTIHRIYHLDRGYERLEEKLRACGAQIERVREREPSAASAEAA
ncbi:MAG: UDP-N-acetylglucosamine 1-carboxyvinyltransferase [Alphaproteobacteria bacterium]|nr:UDP-N-acetylglucosamine 1-carboxyvinyltransferase [Alphaproteobacteria bacterium]